MIEIVDADLELPDHADAVVRLLDAYAHDPLGGGAGLSSYARGNLASELRKRDSAHVVLGMVDGEAAGLLIAFEGFSTFACRPLLNIHDVAVVAEHRGKGVGKLMLGRAEAIAVELGCCKMTLEVLEGNRVAQELYRSLGFRSYELKPQWGKALFWEKKLEPV